MPSVSIVLKRKGLSILSMAFSWSICKNYNYLLFSFVNLMMSLTKNKLLKIAWAGTEQFCSSDMISGKIYFKWLIYA